MITILLATYNSELYIRELLNSLLVQTYDDWNLVVRDDCSSDNTIPIILEYIAKYPEKISILDNEGKKLLAYRNFYELLSRVESDYYMYCDHDDVWLPNKIELSIKRMKDVEKDGVPVVVHTDMKVVDQNLNTISESFWEYSRLLPEHTEFKELVLCNSVNGCTMLFNRRARDLALPHVNHATMHDMLVTQSVAANGGVISPIYTATVLYRQHFDNVVGARSRDVKYQFGKLRKIRYVLSRNYDDWRRSKQIKPYSIFSYFLTKMKVFWWIIRKY